jgi:hypothetical protein
MSEGAHAYHKGVDYKEHHGTEISLLFGQEMAYIIGSENKTIVGMESKLNIGAVADVGLATKVELEFGAEVKWVSGWHFVMAAHGGGVFDGAFAVSAGSADLTAFKTLKIFLSLLVAAQVIAAGVSAGLITTVMAPHKNASGDIEISGNSGFFALTTVNAQLLSLATLILTVALNSLLKKQAHITPISAMSINNQGYGFLGVSAAGTTVATTGSSGLALSPSSFTLSFDSSTRNFENSHHGHEAIGFKTDGSSVIKGDVNGVSVASNQFVVNTTGGAGGAAPAAPPAPTAELTLVPGGLSSLQSFNGTKTASAGLSTQPEETTLFVTDRVSGAGRLALGPNNVSIVSEVAPATATCALIFANGTATLGALNSSAKVTLTADEATLSYGTGKVTIRGTGISFANDALTILVPVAPFPDVATITKLAKGEAERVQTALTASTENKLKSLKTELEADVIEKIANVMREVDIKIGEASVKAGAS